MISLKTNKKGEYVPAPGLRTRKSSIYTPGHTEDFKVSRSKLTDFRKCPKCSYLDRVKGLAYPSTPGWTLNARTGDLLIVKRKYRKSCTVMNSAQTVSHISENALRHDAGILDAQFHQIIYGLSTIRTMRTQC